MKKLLLVLLGMTIAFGSMNAQSQKANYKKSKKLLSNYFFNPSENKNDLFEAGDLINTALSDEKISSDRKAWLTKAKIYNEIANFEVKEKILDPNHVLKHANAGIEAFEAIKKAMELAEKGRHKKAALKVLMETENALNNIAAYEFQDKKYESAFENFMRTCQAFHMFKDNDKIKDSRLADPKLRKEQKLYAGYAAYYGGKKDKAEHFFSELVEVGTDQPFVYEALYNINLEKGDKDKALKYLNDGRVKFGDDTGLLFAEINYYIKEGRLDELTGKLKKAIELDSNNVTVYTTLGSVYDQLHTKAFEAGDEAKTNEYFDLAMKYFKKATEKDPDNFDAIYSIGALYYNSAANYTKEINKLANDFSDEGTRKYDALKKQMLDEFGKALPYFEKAYEKNNSDLGVLQALSEIYARKDMLVKAKEYREKLNVAKAAQGK